MMVKICGITNRADAEAAVAAGASALGFNFCSASPRLVTPEKAAELSEGLSVLRVGIFVNESPANVHEIVRRAKLDIVQLHGTENPADYGAERIWKAHRIGARWSPESWNAEEAEALLLDGPVPGTGVAFDWNIAREVKGRIILAGGLGPENVSDAVKQVRPWGVDACSRLEAAPGIKDHERVRRFVQAAVAAAAL